MKQHRINHLALAAVMAIVVMVISGAILALAHAANSQSKVSGKGKGTAGAKVSARGSGKTPGYHVVWLVEVVGRADLWVCDNGLKMASSTASFLVDGQDLKPIMYNPDSKKCMHFKDKKSFEHVTLMANKQYENRRKSEYSPWEKVGQVKRFGHTCDRFTRRMLNCDHDSQYTSSCVEECIIMPLPKAARLLSMVNSLYHLKDTPSTGLWLERSSIYQEQLVKTKQVTYKEKKQWVRTKSIEDVAIDPAMFKLGKGYKEVNDEGDVLFGGQMTPPGF